MHTRYEFWLSIPLGLNTVQREGRRFQFFEIYIQKVNLGQIMYNSLSCSGSFVARRMGPRENFCDQATKCNTVNALALRGDEGRSKLR